MNDVRQKMGLQTELALGAQLLEDAALGAAHMTVGDENQRDYARGGFWAVAGLSVPGMGSGSPARACCGRSGSGWAQAPVPASAPTR